MAATTGIQAKIQYFTNPTREVFVPKRNQTVSEALSQDTVYSGNIYSGESANLILSRGNKICIPASLKLAV